MLKNLLNNPKLNLTLRKPFTFLLFFISIFCFSQKNKVFIDTTNHDFRKATEVFYADKVSKTKKFIESIQERKIRKHVDANYKEFTDEFFEKIKKGRFINDSRYDKLSLELLSIIQKANPEIPNIKVLFSLGNTANAYNFGDEIVVIYAKLLQKLDNKNQLAFILCHEIGHQMLLHTKKRMIANAENSFSEKVRATSKAIAKQKYNQGELAREATKKIVYGNAAQHRKTEIQADSIGLVFYKKAFPNAKHDALTTLELLDKMDIAKDSLVPADFERFFGSAKQPFKPEWVNNNELKNYQYQKEIKFFAIDSLKTHPDCADRIAILKKFDVNISKTASVKKTDYQDFKNQTRYDELIGLHFLKLYGDSLYETLLLLKINPNDVFLKKMVYENLRKLQDAQKTYTLAKCLDTIDPKYYDSYNLYLFFIRQLRKTELENIIEIYKS